jgi:hypothetical protein
MSGELLTAALRYAALDEWHVFPLHSMRNGACSCRKDDCDRPAKHPRTHHGLLEASTDPDRIRGWWSKWPEANIGIALGTSGLAAIDVDNASAAEAFAALDLPETRTVTTGRDNGGTHHYYHLPSGVELASFVPATGLEVRSKGYYVVAPPSVHPTGRVYTADSTEVATLDTGTIERLRSLARPAGKAPPIAEEIPAGTRHVELVRIAGHLRRAGLHEAEILAALRQVNRDRCKPPVRDDDEGIADIARDIGEKPVGEKPPAATSAAAVFELRGMSHAEALRREIPPTSEIVEHLIEEATVGEIAGLPETHKSFLAVEIGCKVGSGRGKVLGRFPIVKSGPVGYVWQDDSEANELRRLQAYAKRHGHGGDLPIRWYLNEGLRLPEHLDELRRIVERDKLVLLILDSLYNIASGDLKD